MDNNKDLFQEMERSCTLYNTRKASRVITDVYDAILSPSGVRATQLPLLVAIKAYGPLSMSHLAQGIQMDRTTLTRTLKPLQENGWVTIAPGKDRRVQEVRLTDAGDTALTHALPLWQLAQNHVQEQLGREQWGQLLTQLHATAALKAL